MIIVIMFTKLYISIILRYIIINIIYEKNK